jgi:YhgE/Pip-like protein
MKLFTQIGFVARAELRYFARYPKLLLASLVVVLLPALYSVIYLSSVWEPESKTSALSVGLVNLDAGVEYQEHVFNVGWEVAAKLRAMGQFGFKSIAQEGEARQLVREGKLAFALIIPKDFSAQAIPGAEAGGGKLVIYISEGNNFETAGIAKRFAETLGHSVNESLNERRWALVLRNVAGSQRSVNSLRDGVSQLQTGAKKLSTGHTELGKGLAELRHGSQQLKAGLLTQQNEANNSIFMPSEVADNISRATDAMVRLDRGIQLAAEAQFKLAAGAAQLNTGLDLLAGSLPGQLTQPGKNAKGLAYSVAPVMEMDAPVHNSGSGFAANVLPAALWLGAGIAVFLVHVRVLPRHAQFFSRPAQVLGKVAMPSLIVVLQAAVLLVIVLLFLKIHVVSPWAFALTLACSGLTFLLIIFALTRALGDAGKGIAMILLAVQLSSSDGILPIELSGGWFAEVSPWLPLTWVVRALKSTMFGAYNDAWQLPLAIVATAGVSAAIVAGYVGRWRYVKPNTVRPAMDF